MPFQIGEKVQALDEDGQWGNAMVMAIGEDGTYTVNYDGWVASDMVVQEDSIRYCVLPMEQQNPASTRCAPGK